MIINDRVKIRDLMKTDLHIHTAYCDGKNSPEEIVLEAIAKGMECIGFSGHSDVSFEPGVGMNREKEEAYRKEISRLREKYREKIRIFCGIELDYHTLDETGYAEKGPEDPSGLSYYKKNYEYIIGSVHYIKTPEGYAAVDDTPEILKEAAAFFNGDYYRVAEEYYRTVSDVVLRTGADIIGHFDLISKFNEKEKLFDEFHPRYVAAWKQALFKLLKYNRVFEINTGAMSRGYRSVPYPRPEMIACILEQGGRLLYSSDSHRKELIASGFSEAADLVSSCRPGY